MADLAKCAHPSCHCTLPAAHPYGKFCSEHCKKAGQITELRCGCQHTECRERERAVGMGAPAGS